MEVKSLSTNKIPEYLNLLLKAKMRDYLEDYEDEISENEDEAQQQFLDRILPLWNIQQQVNNRIEEYYSGSLGEQAIVSLTELVTPILSMFVPQFMRPKRYLDELPEEVKDQVPNQHVAYNLSELTGIPFPLLLATQFDEFGVVKNIFDLISTGPFGEPMLTQWGLPAISALIEEEVKLPEELAELIRPTDDET